MHGFKWPIHQGTHVLVASFQPQSSAHAPAVLSLWVDGEAALTQTWSVTPTDTVNGGINCETVANDGQCSVGWGEGAEELVGGSAVADCAGIAYGGEGSACAPERAFWQTEDGDVVDLHVLPHAVSDTEAQLLTSTWRANGKAPPLAPPPPTATPTPTPNPSTLLQLQHQRQSPIRNTT